MAYIDEVIGEAAALPLPDAALMLWLRKNRLDREEHPAPKPTMPAADLQNPEKFKVAVHDAITTVRFERDNAQDGPTFTRLKRAHPNADDQDIKGAIVAAVKLRKDCTRYFSHEDPRPGRPSWRDCIKSAIARAKAENPGFLDASYKSAEHDLEFAMR